MHSCNLCCQHDELQAEAALSRGRACCLQRERRTAGWQRGAAAIQDGFGCRLPSLPQPYPPPRASLRVASCSISTSTLPGGSCNIHDSAYRLERHCGNVDVRVATLLLDQVLLLSKQWRVEPNTGWGGARTALDAVPRHTAVTCTYRTTEPRMKQFRTDICGQAFRM